MKLPVAESLLVSGYLSASLHSSHAERCRRCGCSYEELLRVCAFDGSMASSFLRRQEHIELEGEPIKEMDVASLSAAS